MTMKKAMIAMALACVLLASCLTSFAEENIESNQSLDVAEFQELLIATVDLTQYEQTSSSELHADHTLDKAVMEADVNGWTLKLGMSFDEVISAGFEAPEGFADQEAHERLSTSSTFLTPDGKKVSLGFTGKDGDKLSNGILCGIGRDYWAKNNQADVSIDGISVGSDLATLVKVMGEPRILCDNGSNLKMRYEYSDDVIIESVTFYISFDGKVQGLGLGGSFKN